ncbi:dihydrolipoamide acetyltransferase family protein [Proteiniphilum acetatigenes]|uniref:dihydrolipoamide acetyltransferase family protein n=1 Tax=Proteiniphilum acetatigenes TaxID=294710 RepID=UPI00036F6D72|nr:dihydrolipoamide acetyltransferase family protein [Proteiniphilum acetatigenes]SFL54800.1 pyruvate dehydrogenase E2 component (dihydrolipoamide acetyltransferase) [Porphyromonadaceae bacterium KH3CP3RA]
MRFVFNFPDLGEGLEEGTILEWFVSEGDSVKVGDSLVQMETDKVVADIPSPRSGTIAARYGNVGDIIQVGSPLVEIEIESTGESAGNKEKVQESAVTEKQAVVEAGVPVQAISESEDGAAVVGTMELAGEGSLLAASDEGSSETGRSGAGVRKVLATPVARAMAKEMGIDINNVPGSGPSGRVKKEDILNFKSPSAETGDRTDTFTAGIEDVTYKPLTQIRKTIAKNMLHSKHNAAHMSVFEEVEISVLKEVVTKYKPKFAGKDVKLTYLSFVVKAVAQALKQHPQLNSQIDTENNRMIFRNRYHIAIAVDAPDGLVAPVIRDADRLSIFEIAKKIGELAQKARERKLALEDMKEGSFTITSFGSIGGIFATPVINYPQAGILGIGRILKTPIVKDDEIVIGNIMPVSLTVDHRIVDGGETTRFVKRVMDYLSDPVSLLMDD